MRDMGVGNHPTARVVSDLNTTEVAWLLNEYKTYGSTPMNDAAIPLEDVILRLEIELVRRSLNL